MDNITFVAFTINLSAWTGKNPSIDGGDLRRKKYSCIELLFLMPQLSFSKKEY
jgi:hypothetical protein